MKGEGGCDVPWARGEVSYKRNHLKFRNGKHNGWCLGVVASKSAIKDGGATPSRVRAAPKAASGGNLCQEKKRMKLSMKMKIKWT